MPSSAASNKQPAQQRGRPCSAAAALNIVGEKWALLAVREVLYGNRRFDAIARNTGAPRDRLTARLRGLEEAGILVRRAYSERPKRFEYHLTEAGYELGNVILSLVTWGDKWLQDEPPVTFRHVEREQRGTVAGEDRAATGGRSDEPVPPESGPTGPQGNGHRHTHGHANGHTHGHGQANGQGHRLRVALACDTCGRTVDQQDIALESQVPGWTRQGPLTDGD